VYNILVIGAGYVGGAIARYYAGQKQKVYGLVRSEVSARELEACGARPFIADLRRPETLQKIPRCHFTIICPAPDERSEAAYRELYLTGIGNALAELKKGFWPNLICYFSSTGVWRDQEGAWVDETLPADPDNERGRILLEAEKQVLNAGMPSIVVRLAGIYGPGRNRVQAMREGRWPEAAAADRYLNLIHRDDIVAAITPILKTSEAGQVYTLSDDTPSRRSEIQAWLGAKLGLAQAAPAAAYPIGGKRLSNALIKGLGVRLKYPSFRDGYAAILAEEGPSARLS